MFSSLLLYSIKSAIVLTLLYLPYMLMLRRESFFRFNRMVLLGILLLSLTLPLCNVSWMSLDHQPVVQAAQVQMLELGIPVHVLPEVMVMPEGTAMPEASRFSVFMIVSLIYIIGMALLLVVRLWQVGRLQFGLRRGALWQQEEQGIRVYCHAEDVAPFSWMRSIVISQDDYDEAGREIMLHEMGHIRACHSWDVVLLTLVQMVQWWNPLVYVLGISLRDVHEYEADDYVLRQGVSAQAYQLLIIKKAVGSGSYAFANSFKHSLTKKRITMMQKIKSNPWMRSKALYVIPVAALALSAFATPKFVAPIEGAVSKLEGKVTENSSNLQASEEKRKVVEVKNVSKVIVDGKEMAPKEAMKAVQGKEIQNSLTTQPDGSEALSIKTRPKEALIVLNGKVLETKAIDVTSEEQLSKLLNVNPEEIESITCLQKDAATAKWGDKGSNGAIVITTKAAKKATQPSNRDVTVHNPDSIYNVVAVNASFPGGDEGCFKFIAEKMRYPKLCQEFGVSGRVIISFVVEKDGSITEIKKVRAPGKELSEVEVASYKKDHPDSTEKLEAGQDLGELLYEEGVRVLKQMPKWKPAQDKDGNVVRSRFNLPIIFRLR
ncbi:MAG: hypothetical protein IK144_06465 [Bacteroidaceae bacterium]|nr:hypothetical protein [Bacteroidaceae bacterium]